MWLLPAFSALANTAARVYYRLTVAGERVPESGPLLLVANHQNSLLDPTLVCAAARRPVRFLAKAPLFDDPKVGWLVRATGSIPVYRQQDDPALMRRNLDTFRAAYHVLASGAAVGIFPEGRSHSEPSLAELRTGAARIVVGTWSAHQLLVPVVPVGLTFRQKDVFRSEALVVVGAPLSLGDLAFGTAPEVALVRQITERIGAGLRQITLNLESWEDRPLVEAAVDIWDAEWHADPGPVGRVQRLDVTTRLLGDLRHHPDPRWTGLVRDVKDHARRLSRLRLDPASLGARTDAATGVRWTVRRFHLLLPVALGWAVAGLVCFLVPYHVLGFIVSRLRLYQDERSTWELLLGTVVYAVWIIGLAIASSLRWGWVAGLVVAAGLPLIGMGGIAIRERWRGAWSDARRFFLLRSRGDLIAGLQVQQRDLAERFRTLYQERLAKATP
ncbi:MAG TPA: 1-acyl-sn-glycerol-3-phosphate acyltransferase [Gemmatimonadales bacterium]